MGNGTTKEIDGMWQHWNKALHEEPKNRELILEQAINHQVTKTYQLSPGAFITGATLMKRPLSDLLQLSIQTTLAGIS